MALFLENMTLEEFSKTSREIGVAIIPVGAIEPHGTHAPLGFDTFIAREISKRLAEKVGAIILPSISFGCLTLTYDITDWPATIGLSSETIHRLCAELGSELARHGIKRIVFVNAHNPNTTSIETAAYEIWRKTGAAVGILEWWSAAPDEVKEVKGFGFATHGDEVETSILLATEQGTLVDLKKSTTGPSKPDISQEELEMYIAKIKFTHKLDKRWVGAAANYGDPSKSSREKGEKIIQRTVEIGLRLLEALKFNIL